MDRIEIRGIEAWGHHGVLEHETRYGQRFVADLHVELDLAKAGASDDLVDTVDYAKLAAIAAEHLTGPPRRLIETVATEIAAAVLAACGVERVTVTLHKPSAPVGVTVSDISVTVSRTRS